MTHARARLSALVIAAAASLALTGCVPIVGGSDGRDPVVREGTIAESHVVECDGADVAVRDSDRDVRVSGTCPHVEIEGNDLDVDLRGAAVGEVTVRGDRNDIEADDLASVAIAGQENDVEATSIGAVEIRGDRNEVDARGIVGAVRIDGNDNEVEGEQLGDIADNGDRNDVHTH